VSDKDFKVKNKLQVKGITSAGPVVSDASGNLDSTAYIATQYGGTGTATSPSSGQVVYSASGTTYAPTTLTSLDVKGATYASSAPSSPVVGQIWVDSSSTGTSVDPNLIRRQAFTSTAAQTVYTTNVAFIDGYEQVFFNGMLLLRTTDYTTSGNNTITLTSAAAVNDIVEVVTVTNLNSTNTYTQTEIDTIVNTQINNLIASAPATLDTLNELATALGNDANFATTTATSIGNKVSKAGGDIIQSSLSSTIPLRIKGAASQTANLQEWQDSAGTVVTKVGSGGGIDTTVQLSARSALTAGTDNYLSASLSVIPLNASIIGQVIRGAASQTANLTEWQNSAGTKISTVSPLGYLSINKSYTSYPLEVNGSLYAANATAGNLYIQGGNNLIYPSILTGVGGNGWTSVTPNYAVAPDGTTTATRYVWSTSGNCYVFPSLITNTANSTYTASVYVKPNNSTGKFDIRVSTAISSMFAVGSFNLSDKSTILGQVVGGTNSSASSIYIGNGWYRVWVTTTVTSSYNNLTAMITASVDGGDISVWGVQLEQGYYASAYTPTTNAAVTSTNNLYVPSGSIYSPSIQSLVSNTATLNTNGDTGGILINTVAAANKGLIVKGAASQTANLQEWQNSAGTVLAGVDSSGSFYGSTVTAYGLLIANSSFRINNASAGTVAAIFKGAASQTADLQQWQSSAGTTYLNVTNAGALISNGGVTIASNPTINAYGAAMVINSGVNTYPMLILKGAASQTANLQEWQNSAGSVVSSISNTGLATFSNIGVTSNINAYYGKISANTQALGYLGQLSAITANASTIGLVLRGAASQTANLQEWQDSSGTAKAYVNSYGDVAGQAIVGYYSGLFYSGGYAVVPMTVRGISGQTANLQEWQNSAGTALSKVDASGAMFTITPADSTNTTQVATTAYVKSNIANLISSAPATLDTLNELATALGNDASFSTTVINSLSTKKTEISSAISANTTLVAGRRYFVTSASALTLTLPASPAQNDQVDIFDASGNSATYNITLGRNSSLINGNAGNFIIDANGYWASLVYTGATYGWKVG